MVQVTYVGACLDGSGYAEAARNNIAALYLAGVDLNVAPISFEQKRPALGEMGKLITKLQKARIGDKIFILHATPPNYSQLVKPGRYNIGYAAWETDQLPRDWVTKINTLDEVWVPSQYNVKVFKDSGITIPIHCFPHTFNFNQEEEVSKNPVLEPAEEGEFTFYSIFQWLERKNPAALLRAFLTEFKAEEKVRLVMKSYCLNPGMEEDIAVIRRQVKQIKDSLHLPSFPKILLISSLLSRGQIRCLHIQGDCYVSLHKCEGFGIPMVEAMAEANPVIATGYSGSDEFIQVGQAYPVKYTKAPVWGMPWPMYTGEMTWAEPSLLDARKQMRFVFENQGAAWAAGSLGKAFVEQNFSWKKIGEAMKARLEGIKV